MTKLFRGCILGAPASGKGTISKMITTEFDVTHVSTGDIFRLNISRKTQLGMSVQKYTCEGKLVPDVLVTRIVSQELQKLENTNWLIDGYPRTLVQSQKLLMMYPLNLAICLKVPFEVIINRVKGRWIHVPSGRVYHTEFCPPKVPGKDDVTGEPLEQRSDDDVDVVRDRLKIYEETMGPVEDYYKEKGILKEFKGETTASMWPSIRETLLQHIKPKS